MPSLPKSPPGPGLKPPLQPVLQRAVQIAYAASDVSTAAARLAATTGAGPFFIARHIPLRSARIHGKPAEFDHSSAHSQ